MIYHDVPLGAEKNALRRNAGLIGESKRDLPPVTFSALEYYIPKMSIRYLPKREYLHWGTSFISLLSKVQTF